MSNEQKPKIDELSTLDEIIGAEELDINGMLAEVRRLTTQRPDLREKVLVRIDRGCGGDIGERAAKEWASATSQPKVVPGIQPPADRPRVEVIPPRPPRPIRRPAHHGPPTVSQQIAAKIVAALAQSAKAEHKTLPSAGGPSKSAAEAARIAEELGPATGLKGKPSSVDREKMLRAAQKLADKPKPKTTGPSILDRPLSGRDGDLISGFEDVPDAPKPPPGASLKDRLTYPPSRLLGYAVAHAVGSTRWPDRQLALWGALTGMAKILDRRVIGPTDASTLLFNLLLAASGAGKEEAIQFAILLLRAVGYQELLKAGMVTSVQAVEDIVNATPNALVITDEFGRFFKMIQDQSGNVSQLPGVLQKLWGQKPHGVYPSMRRARDSEEKEVLIQWPAFAISGASVSEPFWKACGDEHISGGLLNRFLILDAGIGATDRAIPTHDPHQLPDWMVKAMRAVTRGAYPQQSKTIELDGASWGPSAIWRLKWASPEIEEMWLDNVTDIRKLPEGKRRDLFIRAPEIAVRLATVAAVWDGCLVVRGEHYEWGWAFANYSCDTLLRGANENMQVKRDLAEICKHIKSLLANKGPMRWTDIRLATRSAAGQWGMEIVRKALTELVECHEIRLIGREEAINRGLRGERGADGEIYELIE